jgi:hypothetical protein
LDERDISKNINKDEVVFVKAFRNQYPQSQGVWSWLVFGDDVLLNNGKLEERFAEFGLPALDDQYQIPRVVMFIYLPFNFAMLDDPTVFRNFRRLLFFTRVHFETSFERRVWEADDRGLYARSAELRAGLSRLSDLHNEVVAALKQFREKKPRVARNILRDVFAHNASVVMTSHHRQISDVLAVLLLVLRAGFNDVYLWLICDIIHLARRLIPQNDPRRVMFEFLETLPRGPDSHVQLSHLYFAFDAYCRHIWMSKMGGNNFKAYISYNQASFPRADPGGFYEFFEGKDLGTITAILASADEQLGPTSHETFLLWHTALRLFLSNGRSTEMVTLAQSLCLRLHPFTQQWDQTRPRQLYLDSALSYYLLGQAYESSDEPLNAFVAYDTVVHARNLVVADNRRDTTREAARERLHGLGL